ncbi:ead/Ea22-like family protein [Enterobacter chuandaensis]|uniref:Ead/Ea22-like family protein n=1 Tax=Enterobacter chuandaensis TaxID=2497875 RepID=A0ABV5A322_9ENTR
MVERFSMNPVSCKLLNEAWKKEFPDEVAVAERMLALLDELEAKEVQRANWFQMAQKLGENLDAAEKRIAELKELEELFLRAKALMHQSGGTPIGNSLNPIDAWLYDAERAAAAGKGE